jgi:1-deoxy-D-xylulose-5-phosphate reductoisomerase
MQKSLTLLGSTGSIGDSTLDVVARHPERFSVLRSPRIATATSSSNNACASAPEVAVVGDAANGGASRCEAARSRLQDRGAYGAQALVEVAKSDGCDTVMAAIVGAAGLPPAWPPRAPASACCSPTRRRWSSAGSCSSMRCARAGRR